MSDLQEKIKHLVDQHVHAHADASSETDRNFLHDHPELLPDLEKVLNRVRLIRRSRMAADSESQSRSQVGGKDESSIDIKIPGYQLLSRIARGGQGIVFHAIQESTRRDVALKLLHHSMDPDQHEISRFRHEVRILSSIRHSNVISIIDSGVTNGQFYIVMEFVEGMSLLDYFNEANSSVDDKLKTIATICDAVHHAHRRGITHRDLKPTNIRVDAEGSPYVLDFGLAKMIPTEESQLSMSTATGQFVGSLPWAAPEQVDPAIGAVDTRTDVYALGVILFTALTDEPPYFVHGSVRQTMDNILFADPAPPSSHETLVTEDIETIILKCLSKEADRRYQNAGELRDDIERYLTGHPIDARRESRLYVFRKAISRHKLAFTSASLILALLVSFSIVVGVLYFDAERGRNRYKAATESLEEFLTFETRNLSDTQVPLRDLLDQHAELVCERMKDDPNMYGKMLNIISVAYGNLRLYDQAYEYAERCLQWQTENLGPHAEETLVALHRVAKISAAGVDLARAEEAYVELLEASKSEEVRPNFRRTIFRQYAGFMAYARGQHEEALRVLGELYNAGDFASRDQQATIGFEYGLVLFDTGRFKEAEEWLKRTVAIYAEVGNEENRIWAMQWLGLLYKDMNRFDLAEPILIECANSESSADQPVNRGIWAARMSLAKLYADFGRLEKGMTYAEQALFHLGNVVGEKGNDVSDVLTLIGRLHVLNKDGIAAEDYLRRALTATLRDKTHWESAKTRNLLGAALGLQGKFDAGEALLLESFPVIKANRKSSSRNGTSPRVEHRRTREAMDRIVKFYLAWNKPNKAQQWKEKLHAAGGIDPVWFGQELVPAETTADTTN